MIPFITPHSAKAMPPKLFLALALSVPLASQAVEMDWSGFGTVAP